MAIFFVGITLNVRAMVKDLRIRMVDLHYLDTNALKYSFLRDDFIFHGQILKYLLKLFRFVYIFHSHFINLSISFHCEKSLSSTAQISRRCCRRNEPNSIHSATR